MVAVFCTSGLSVTQIGGLDRDPLSEIRGEQLRDVSISVKEKEKAAESTERRKTAEEQRSEGLTPETNPEMMEEKITAGLDVDKEYEQGSEERPTPQTFSKILGEEPKIEEFSVAEMKGDEVERREETNEESKTVKEILTDNTKTWETIKTLDSRNTRIQEKEKDDETLVKPRQEMEEEEKESKLVAGINLHQETRGGAHEGGEKTANQENVEEKRGNEEREKREKEAENIKNAKHNELAEREKEDHIVVSNLTPPFSTTQLGGEFKIPATIQIITRSQNPPSSHHHHKVPPSLLVIPTQVPSVSLHPPIPHGKVSHHSSVTLPNPTTLNHMSDSTVAPGEVRSVLRLEDLLTEVLQSPGHHLKQNEFEGRASPNLEEVMVENILSKPAQKELQTTREINTDVQPKQAEFIPKVQAATPKPTRVKFITKDLKTKESNSTLKPNENNPTAKLVEFTLKTNMTQPTGKPKTGKRMENDMKLTVKQNKASPPQPQLTKPSAKTQLTTAKTPSMKQRKINRSSKNKKTNKSKEKKRKKDNRTQKLSEKKEVITPTHFPYFMDDYCPPECACYGR